MSLPAIAADRGSPTLLGSAPPRSSTLFVRGPVAAPHPLPPCCRLQEYDVGARISAKASFDSQYRESAAPRCGGGYWSSHPPPLPAAAASDAAVLSAALCLQVLPT